MIFRYYIYNRERERDHMDWVEPGKCSPIWCPGATSDESRSPPADEISRNLPPVVCKWKRLLGIIKETQKKNRKKKTIYCYSVFSCFITFYNYPLIQLFPGMCVSNLVGSKRWSRLYMHIIHASGYGFFLEYDHPEVDRTWKVQKQLTKLNTWLIYRKIYLPSGKQTWQRRIPNCI